MFFVPWFFLFFLLCLFSLLHTWNFFRKSKKRLLQKSRLNRSDIAFYSCYRHVSYYSNDYLHCYYYRLWVSFHIEFMALYFDFFSDLMPPRHKFYYFSPVTFNNRLSKKAIPYIYNMLRALMDCIGTNTMSGDGGGNMSCFSCILLFYLNTSARMSTDCAQTLTQEEQCTLGECWVEIWGSVGAHLPPRSQLAQDAGSSMSARPFHHRPFVSQPCRTLGASRGSWRWFDFQHQRRVLKTSTHLCFQPSVCKTAIWWALDAQARLILWVRQNFFLPMF